MENLGYSETEGTKRTEPTDVRHRVSSSNDDTSVSSEGGRGCQKTGLRSDRDDRVVHLENVKMETQVEKDMEGLGHKETGLNSDREVAGVHFENVKMERQLGLPSGVAFIVGSMIGSGIFVSPKNVILGTGSVAASLLVWTVCGVIALLGSLCYAELGTMIPKSGGEYTYTKESLGSVPAYLNVWTNFVLSRISSQAIVSLTFAQYLLAPFFDDCGPPNVAPKLLAAAAILTVTAVNCYSATLAARVQVVFTVIKVSALVVVIVGGLVMLGKGHTDLISTGFEGTKTSPSELALGFIGGLYAYGGWNTLNDLTEEVVNPVVNLPRAMLIGVPLVMLIYVLTNVSYLTMLSTDELLASPAVAVSWAQRVLGSLYVIIPLSVACSTFGALNSSAFRGSRLCYVAGRDGNFPSILSYVHVHQLTPWCSLLVPTVGSLIMIYLGDIRSLLNFTGFTSWVLSGLTFVGLIVMRFTRKDCERPYKVPIVIPLIMVGVSAFLVITPIVDDPRIEIIYAALFIAGGLIFYIPFIHFKLQIPCMGSFIQWVQLFLEVAPSRYEM